MEELGGAGDGGPVKVTYIGGYGRSGSTLLDRLLGQLDGFFSVGELRFIWQRGLTDNERCGCGELFRSCPFWSAVFDRAFGGFDAANAHRMLELMPMLDRGRRIPQLGWPARRSEAFEAALKEYAGALGRLYAAVRDVSGCRVIVDSSKEPSYAFMLLNVPTVDLRVVHLVRDSRATAYAWQKKVVRPATLDGRSAMATFGPALVAYRWAVRNQCMALIRSRTIHYLRVRYEDLIDEPGRWMRRIVDSIGESEAALPNYSNGQVELAANHIVSGNPMRFQTGRVTLRKDVDWRAQLPMTQKALVTAMTLPWLMCFGYV